MGRLLLESRLRGASSLYFDFVGAGAGTGTGVAILDVSVEPDKEEGTLIADMESGSNGLPGVSIQLSILLYFGEFGSGGDWHLCLLT